VPVPLEPLHEMGAQEAPAAGDEHAHGGKGTATFGPRQRL
jgi:hypothetical protein